MKSKKPPANPVETALAWVESIRRTEGGFSENEKKLIALADEVKKLRRDLRTAQMQTRRGALTAVPTPANADSGAEACIKFIDETGAPPMPKPEWLEMLEEIISQCRSRIEATREEMRNEAG